MSWFSRKEPSYPRPYPSFSPPPPSGPYAEAINETLALQSVVRELGKLSADSRNRVLRWAKEALDGMEDEPPSVPDELCPGPPM